MTTKEDRDFASQGKTISEGGNANQQTSSLAAVYQYSPLEISSQRILACVYAYWEMGEQRSDGAMVACLPKKQER